MAVLTRAQIDATKDIHKELVAVPDWGGDVYVRVLTVGERLRCEDHAGTDAERVIYFCSISMCGEDGLSLYGPEGLKELGKKSGYALMAVRDAALRVNKMTKEDVEEVKKN